MGQNNSVTLKENDVKKIANLAKLPIEEKDMPLYISQLGSILSFVSKLQNIETKEVKPTAQVTGRINVFREDVIDTSRMLSQEEVLENARETSNGYIVVPQIL